MKKFTYLLLAFAAVIVTACSQKDNTTVDKYQVITETDANGYSYQRVEEDPMKARIYTLDNGLKVYLTVNKDEPRIQTFIPVKAGSTYDPAETTGLAHYFEHMMFKGT